MSKAKDRARQRRKRREIKKSWSCLTDEEIREYTPERRCPSCKKTRPSSEFVIGRDKRDGLATQCRTCAIITQAKYRARRDGFPHTLTWQEIGDPPDECPCCGQAMPRGSYAERRNSPSLDKIVPELGYTAQNAVWICLRCNAIKQDASSAELYVVADWLWEQYKERGLPLPRTRLHGTLGVEQRLAGGEGPQDGPQRSPAAAASSSEPLTKLTKEVK